MWKFVNENYLLKFKKTGSACFAVSHIVHNDCVYGLVDLDSVVISQLFLL